MNETTIDHRGYTIYKQPQGGFYICGIKVVKQTQKEAIAYIDEYLSKNAKARQASLVKAANRS
ncbi:MAG: hypothetical protein ABQ298_10595 [Puniceicoccaceae bacterium]